MGNFGNQEQLELSLSQGKILPNTVLTKTLPEFLDSAAKLDTGIISCNPQGQTDFQSYGDLLQEASSILYSLRKSGSKPQSEVILQLKTPRYFFASLWACF